MSLGGLKVTLVFKRRQLGDGFDLLIVLFIPLIIIGCSLLGRRIRLLKKGALIRVSFFSI
ncbi:YjcZ family sporulation protein [Bacillus cereus group sp. TH152-1LC]|uniref:YjcZ family sporulation protein n=1 Tax=Bacillus cereus group sp. TH152-1LC TaxID=3018060 RepID=UPI003FA48D6E